MWLTVLSWLKVAGLALIGSAIGMIGSCGQCNGCEVLGSSPRWYKTWCNFQGVDSCVGAVGDKALWVTELLGYFAVRVGLAIQESQSWLVDRSGNQDTVVVSVIGRLRSRTSCCTGHGRLARYVGLTGMWMSWLESRPCR